MELAGFLVGMLRTSGPSPAPLSSRTCPVLPRQQVTKAGALQTIIGTVKQKINKEAEVGETEQRLLEWEVSAKYKRDRNKEDVQVEWSGVTYS